MRGQDAVRFRVAALARGQHGVVSRRQLLDLGVTGRQVEGWLNRGELTLLHRGVYLVGPVEAAHTREMAAILACGERTAVSHVSGLYLYELLPYPARRGPVHVTVAGHHCRGAEGIVVHETTQLMPHEIRERHGIPVTAPSRTLIDFAADCTDEELERTVSEAFALGLTQRAPLLREVERHRGRRGTARVRALLEGGGPRRTRSRPERTLLRHLRAADLPEPEGNVRIGQWEADFYWAAYDLVVEVDAYSTHSSPRAFERDRRKTAALEERGLCVHRVTDRRIYDEPAAVVAEIRRRIARAAR